MIPRVELVDTALPAFKPAPERVNPLLDVRKSARLYRRVPEEFSSFVRLVRNTFNSVAHQAQGCLQRLVRAEVIKMMKIRPIFSSEGMMTHHGTLAFW